MPHSCVFCEGGCHGRINPESSKSTPGIDCSPVLKIENGTKVKTQTSRPQQHRARPFGSAQGRLLPKAQERGTHGNGSVNNSKAGPPVPRTYLNVVKEDVLCVEPTITKGQPSAFAAADRKPPPAHYHP